MNLSMDLRPKLPAVNRYFLFTTPCLIAVAVLILNDHVLKAHYGAGPIGMVTGKLSDFAGAVILPAWIEFVLAAGLKLRRRLALTIACIVSALGLAAIELSPLAVHFYELANNLVLGSMAHLFSVNTGEAKLTADFSDLIAIMMVPWVWRKNVQDRH